MSVGFVQRRVGAGTTRCHDSDGRPLSPLSPGDGVSGPRNLAHRLHFAREWALVGRRPAGDEICIARHEHVGGELGTGDGGQR